MKNQLTVFKIGGNILNDDTKRNAFLRSFSDYKGHKILVHGGGRQASVISQKLGVTPHLRDGRRITDAATLEVVTMVYAGLLNKRIASELQALGCNALGLSGADANSIQAQKRPVQDIDYGWVGDIKEVNDSILKVLIKEGLTPVFCAITHDKKGQLLNTNADTIAAELSKKLSATFKTNLYLCFEEKGVLLRREDKDSVMRELNYSQFKQYQKTGIISEGMLPKLDNGFSALKKGVEVKIGNPVNIFQSPFSGTKLVK